MSVATIKSLPESTISCNFAYIFDITINHITIQSFLIQMIFNFELAKRSLTIPMKFSSWVQSIGKIYVQTVLRVINEFMKTECFSVYSDFTLGEQLLVFLFIVIIVYFFLTYPFKHFRFHPVIYNRFSVFLNFVSAN
jgi:hypothetical protein